MVADTTIQLTQRDLNILSHVRTFRMTTDEVLKKLFFDGQDLDAVKSCVRRLKDAGYVAKADFISPRRYIHLTPRALETLYGKPGKAAKALGAFALARQYAILGFCCLGETVHRKVTPEEFAELFPGLADNSLPKDFYYVDKSAQPQRLGFIYVDHGRNARRIHQRYRQIVTQRFRLPAWRRELIDRDRFIVAIVTAKDEKKKRIEEAFAEERDLVPHRVDVVPDLIHLV